MLKQKILIPAISFLMVWAALPPYPWAEELTLPEDPMIGRSLYYSKGCFKCHSIRGQGGRVGPDLSQKSQNRSVTQLAGSMWNHFPRMFEKMQEIGIPFPAFTSNEMAELIAYIYFMGYFDEPATAADRLKGKTLFFKKGCVNCHYLEKVGGNVGPDLTRWSKFASPILWAQLMWNHSPTMSEKMKEAGIPRPQFASNEMRDLIAYVYQASRPPKQDVVYNLPGNPARGQKLFKEKMCINCHTVFGKGGDIGPSLTAKRYSRSLMQLAGIMWNHSPAMFEKMEQEGILRPRFSGGEMADVVAYLFFLGYFNRSGDPAKGREVFLNKGCIQCHTVRGEGGKVGPELTKYSRTEEPLQPVLIAQTMWNHAPLMVKAYEKKQISWPQFKERDMDDLMAFIKGPGSTR